VEEGSSRKIAELTNEFKNSVDLKEQRTLFDPRNPGKPIVVPQTSSSRPRDFTNVPEDHQQYLSTTKPVWVKKNSEQYQNFKHKHLLDDLNRLDDDLMAIVDRGDLLQRWQDVLKIRKRIEGIFEELLSDDMRFCQSEHVEHHFWKLLFYRIIEVLRKQIQESDEASKASFKEKALETVDYGTKYFESILKLLENRHKFRMDDFIGDNAASFKRGMGYVGLALVSAQKIFLFLGDLARYREQINQTNNFGRAKNFYVKAQQVVPKNGRPFNQLALLAVYSVSFLGFWGSFQQFLTRFVHRKGKSTRFTSTCAV
jgi:protein SMG6